MSLSAAGFGSLDHQPSAATTPTTPVAFAVRLDDGSSRTHLRSLDVRRTAIVQLRAKASMRDQVLALQAIVFLGSTPDRRPDPRLDLHEHLGARAGPATGAITTLGAAARPPCTSAVAPAIDACGSAHPAGELCAEAATEVVRRPPDP